MKYIIVFFLFIHFKSSLQANFGDDCTNENYCQDGSQCYDSQCKCPESQEYFQTFRQCGLRVGSNCQDNEYSCVQGSTCDESSKTCRCKAPAKALSNGACSSVHNQPCSSTHSCTSGLFLECINGNCQCSSPINMVMDGYNHENQTTQCRAVAPGGRCSNTGTQFPRCVENSECINGACQCKEGYGPTLHGPCKKMYLESCEIDSNGGSYQCNEMSGLVCKYGSCLCSDISLFWDEDKEACVGQVGSPCISNSYERISCADPNSSCQLPGNNMRQRPICKCNAGYKQYYNSCIPDPDQPNCQCSQNNFRLHIQLHQAWARMKNY